MSQVQALMDLSHFLSDNVRTQYRPTQSGSRTTGLTCWLEGVQYLIRTYTTLEAIRNVTNELRSVSQTADEY